MSGNFYTDRAAHFKPIPQVDKPEMDGLGFLDTTRRVIDQTEEATVSAQIENEKRLITEYVDSLNKITDGGFSEFNADDLGISDDASKPRQFGAFMLDSRDKFEKKVLEMKELYPEIEVKNFDQLKQEAAQERRAAELKAQAGTEGESIVGSFLGTTLGYLKDPAFLGTSAVGATAGGIPGMIAINMASEAAYQSMLGDKPLAEKAQEVGMVGVISGVLGVAGKGIAKGIQKIVSTVESKGTKSIAAAMEETVEELTKADKTDLDVDMSELIAVDLRAEANLLKKNPLGDTVKAKRKYAEYISKAQEQFNSNRANLPDIVEGSPRRVPLTRETANLERQILRGTETPSVNRVLTDSANLETRLDDALADIQGQVTRDIDVPRLETAAESLDISRSKVSTVFDEKGKPMIFDDSASAQRAATNLAESKGELASLYKIAATQDGRFAVTAPTDSATIPKKVFKDKKAAEASISRVAKELALDADDIAAVPLEDGKYGLATNATAQDVLSLEQGLPSSVNTPRARVDMNYDFRDVPPIAEATDVVQDVAPESLDRYVKTRIEQILSNDTSAEQFAKSLNLESKDQAVKMIKDVRTVIKKFKSECLNG